jgi:hypothetical protein
MGIRTAPLYPRAPLYLLLVFATALVGFWPSYFARLRQTDLVHHLHGMAAGAWLLMLIAQAWLYRQRRMTVHRRLGRVSLVLAPLFVVSGLAIVHAMLASANPFSAAFGPGLAFVDLTTLAWFATAYTLAIRHRRDTPLHSRYLLSTAVLVLPPALARALPPLIPAIHSFASAFNVTFAVTETIALALVVHDLREGRLRAPYALLLALLVVQHVGFFVAPSWEWWMATCRWIAAL